MFLRLAPRGGSAFRNPPMPPRRATTGNPLARVRAAGLVLSPRIRRAVSRAR